jgi:hypothetical protein
LKQPSVLAPLLQNSALESDIYMSVQEKKPRDKSCGRPSPPWYAIWQQQALMVGKYLGEKFSADELV